MIADHIMALIANSINMGESSESHTTFWYHAGCSAEIAWSWCSDRETP